MDSRYLKLPPLFSRPPGLQVSIMPPKKQVSKIHPESSSSPESQDPFAPFSGHSIPHDQESLVAKWLSSLTPAQRQLQSLASEMFRTSYFPEKTHGFRKWLASQKQV